MPDLRTMQDVNAWLEYCGHCPFELTPAPRKECQSLEGTAAVDGFAPFLQPAGDPTDDLPTIYGDEELVDETKYTGTASRYVSFEDPGDSREALIVETYVNWQGPGLYDSYSLAETFTSWIAGVCGSVSFAFAGDSNKAPADVTYTQTSDVTECLPTSHLRTITGTSASGILGELAGCPGPFGDHEEYYWNFTRAEITGPRLVDPKTKEELIDDAITAIPSAWPEVPTGSDCAASLDVTWPTIGDIGEWPDCDTGPPGASAAATAVRSRYRYRVPADYARSDYQAQWDDYFFPAAWDAWNSGGRIGTEPTPPTLIGHRSWTWSGGVETASDWIYLAAPTEPGEVRSVNFMAKAGNTRWGNKPTAHGEIYAPTTP